MFLPFGDLLDIDLFLSNSHSFTLLGILLICTGVSMLYKSRLKEESLPVFRVPESGRAEAVIIGITRGLRTSSDEPETFHVIAECQQNGNAYRFTGKEMAEYPGKSVIGKKVNVIFTDSDPENYSVDLSAFKKCFVMRHLLIPEKITFRWSSRSLEVLIRQIVPTL